MRPAIIGLTGGIGSGKTTVALLFKSLGVPVYIADTEAKEILFTPVVMDEVLTVFSDGVFTDNKPDRKKLAALVFNNPGKLEHLNNIIHPKVREHFLQWVQMHQEYKFVIKEAAILFESGSYKHCDQIILVTAPQEQRIQRVMERDKITKDEVLQRIANQWDEDKKISLSNIIIENTKLENTKKQVAVIYETLNQ